MKFKICECSSLYRVPKSDPSEGNQPTESLEELIKACNEQISTNHLEIEKLRKNTNFCITRLIDNL